MDINKIVSDGLQRDREANGNLELRNAEARKQLVEGWKRRLTDAPLVLEPYLRFRMRLELSRFDTDAQNLYLTQNFYFTSA